MAIRGSLKEASLPDVLQLLALGQKTGCLSIADRSNFGYIYFDKGRICYASIVNRRDRLGDILVKHEKIVQAQLDAAIERQAKERDKKLGEILVAMGSISGTLGTPHAAAYNASKWGLTGFIKSLAEEGREQGVFCAVVLPGSVDTEMLKKTSFPPQIQAGEVAQVVRFLAGEAPFAMTGSAVEVFG